METRRLEERDVALAVELTNAEGWGFTADEIHRLLRVGGGYVLEEGDEALGLLTATRYPGLAWIGNVIVRPEQRGRGLGRRVLEDALQDLERDGIHAVGLYSVLPAITLYERAGFQRVAPSWSLAAEAPRPAAPPVDGVRPLRAPDLDAVVAFDQPRFGADRRTLLATLLDAFPDQAFLLERDGRVEGFAFGKPSPSGSEVGPVVTRAGDRAGLAALFDAVLDALPEGPVEAGVRAENPLARELLEARGFRESFPALTMVRGERPRPAEPSALAAVGGMEKG